jgi:hypothetical protein
MFAPSFGANNVQSKSGDRVGGAEPLSFLSQRRDRDPEDATGHIGETATVCGVVASAKFAPGSRAQPTFLDFGNPYPNTAFTAVIWRAIGPSSARPKRRSVESVSV